MNRLAQVSRGLRCLLVALAGFVAVVWLTTAVMHADDAFGNDRVSGAWLVLGERADQGTLYPPLVDHGSFAGTRWMPLPILVFAIAHRFGGHGYLPAKLAVYLIGLVLLAALYLSIRHFGTPRSIAAGLVAVLVTTNVGFDAVTTIAGDALALVFALLALAVVAAAEDRIDRRTTLLAAGLGALAVLSKSSSLWVVATIGLFLLAGPRRLAALFVAATALFVGAGVLLTQVASDGRFLSNVRALSVAGYGGAAHLVVDTPIRVVSLAQNFAAATWLLAPLAVGIALVRFSTRSWTVFDVALPVVAIATVGILADAGTYVNHLLEGSAIVLVLVGSIWSRAESDPARALEVILCAAVCLALIVGIATTLKPIAGQTLDDIRADGSLRYGPQLAAPAVHGRDTLLAEDPGIPYELRRRPVVADAFMLPRIGRRYPLELALLTRKIRDGRFDKIILDGAVTDRFYYTNGDLGPAVSTAIARRYELKRVVAGRFVYVPRVR